jgi:hypothetical protein
VDQSTTDTVSFQDVSVLTADTTNTADAAGTALGTTAVTNVLMVAMATGSPASWTLDSDRLLVSDSNGTCSSP